MSYTVTFLCQIKSGVDWEKKLIGEVSEKQRREINFEWQLHDGRTTVRTSDLDKLNLDKEIWF